MRRSVFIEPCKNKALTEKELELFRLLETPRDIKTLCRILNLTEYTIKTRLAKLATKVPIVRYKRQNILFYMSEQAYERFIQERGIEPWREDFHTE